MTEIISQFDNSLTIALEECLNQQNYDLAIQAMHDNRHASSLKNNCSDIMAVLVTHMTDDTFSKNPKLYETCETLLKLVAEKCSEDVAFFEFLEVLETTKSDNVFTSTLKVLQLCLLRHKEKKPRSLEWCFNSILTYIFELPLSENIRGRIDSEADHLLEENDEVRRIITNYLFLFLFYEPILDDILLNKQEQIFRNVDINRSNVMMCALLQFFSPPLAYLNLSRPEDKSLTNTYSWQIVTTLVKHFIKLCPDPCFLFKYVERRIRWPLKTQKLNEAVYEEAPRDIFALEDKTPFIALGVFYYVLYVESLMPASAPQIYTPLYQFESILYLTAEMLKTNEHSLHFKALRLCEHMLNTFGRERIPSSSLDLNIHETFVVQLIRMSTETPVKTNSQFGGTIIRKYIFQFDDSGRIFLISNLFKMTNHNGLYAYLAVMFKNIVAEALNSSDNQISLDLSGDTFERIMMKNICNLINGTETDLLQYSDQIISALNICRFFALRDRANRTGFWYLVVRLREEYLEPLQKGLDLTKAHYRLEQCSVQDGVDQDNMECTLAVLGGGELPQINKEEKLKMIASALNTFDLMESLLSMVNECVRDIPHEIL